jgi:hypothetical protein
MSDITTDGRTDALYRSLGTQFGQQHICLYTRQILHWISPAFLSLSFFLTSFLLLHFYNTLSSSPSSLLFRCLRLERDQYDNNIKKGSNPSVKYTKRCVCASVCLSVCRKRRFLSPRHHFHSRLSTPKTFTAGKFLFSYTYNSFRKLEHVEWVTARKGKPEAALSHTKQP